MQQYLKAIIAFLGGISAWGITAATDNSITLSEWWGLPAVVATALVVLAVPNKSAP